MWSATKAHMLAFAGCIATTPGLDALSRARLDVESAKQNTRLLARGVSEPSFNANWPTFGRPKYAHLQELPKQGRQDSNLQPPVLETGQHRLFRAVSGSLEHLKPQ
jgi:hypothetical protein